MEGKKYDKGKVRMDLVPLDVVENVAKILTMGAEKYSENSWQELPNFWSRYKAALLRHLAAIDKGELVDPESGLPHIDHVLCNAMFLSWGHHHGKAIKTNVRDVEEDRTEDSGRENIRTTEQYRKIGTIIRVPPKYTYYRYDNIVA